MQTRLLALPFICLFSLGLLIHLKLQTGNLRFEKFLDSSRSNCCWISVSTALVLGYWFST